MKGDNGLGDQSLRDERFCGERRADVEESKGMREGEGRKDVARKGIRDDANPWF